LNWVDEDFTLIDKKEHFLEAHIGTFSRQGNQLTWVKLKLLYQENFTKPVAG